MKLLENLKDVSKELIRIKHLYHDIHELQEKILSASGNKKARKALMAAIDFKTKSAIHFFTYSKDGDKYLIIFDTDGGCSICFKGDSINGGIKYEHFHPEKMFEPLEE